MSPERTTVVEVEGKRLTLTNLGKVLYPEAGFTKAAVISYYVQIAPVLLPHVAGRPVTLARFPDGVGGSSFFEKRLAVGAPDWVPTIDVPRSSRAGATGLIRSPAIADLATLVWAANLAALELHVPLWRTVRPGEFGPFDQMVFDLDPGEPASIVECCQVARWLVEGLHASGHRTVFAKTSGSKGLQLYVPLDPARHWAQVREEARALARAVEAGHRDVVVSNMRRDLRGGKVLIDWSQNSPTKTTVAAYSLRARPWPTVSTPVTLDEVAHCADTGDGEALRFVASGVVRRVERFGDLFDYPGPRPQPRPSIARDRDDRSGTDTVPRRRA